MLRRALLAALVLVSAPAVADAQIYAWRDSGGNLVLSDKPKDPSARTYAVASTGAFRTTMTPANRPGTTTYDDLIADHASRHSLNPDFVKAVIQAESGFNPRARSVKGALGLMQLMPATASEYGVLDAFNPIENIRAGVAYLKSLLVRYNQDESLALAAYNAGPSAVEKYGRTVPPYRETRQYVTRIRNATANAGPPPTRIYRVFETIDGREIVRYTNKPSPGAELVTAARR